MTFKSVLFCTSIRIPDLKSVVLEGDTALSSLEML